MVLDPPGMPAARGYHGGVRVSPRAAPRDDDDAMNAPLEDYALIGDLRGAGLVAKNGSIDWLCVPRFDSGACFAALLGTPEHGRFLLAPSSDVRGAERRYRGDTLILETDLETDDGIVRLVDLMPPETEPTSVVRIIRGIAGRVAMRMELVIRLHYGSIVPWVRRADDVLVAMAGPDGLTLHTPVEFRGKELTTVAEFEVAEGDEVPFVLSWFPSHRPPPRAPNATELERRTERWWTAWSGRCTYEGDHRDAVMRSLIVLRALMHSETGGIVAAPTTSLPELIGGSRNWDYRFCWLRDAAASVEALVSAGYDEEAAAWIEWLLRAVGGDPGRAQILYGIAGERTEPEIELDWLPGYEGSRPVRIGNRAVEEVQLDVYGEVMDALLQARRSGVRQPDTAWGIERALIEFLERNWDRPDRGLWEFRDEDRPFTHSRMMSWVAFDRAIGSAQDFGLDGPIERWREIRDEIREQIEREGFDEELGAFVQFYGSRELDASLLQMPLVGFLQGDDPRLAATVEAIRRTLGVDGLIMRYDAGSIGGIDESEGAFIAATLWLSDALELIGRRDEAIEVFERVLELRNDVGLLSEEYDVERHRLIGNFPQALSHLWIVLAARNLSGRPPSGRHVAHQGTGRVSEDRSG
jgi:GH15 family glucan-1,4-alpha-glucosidase